MDVLMFAQDNVIAITAISVFSIAVVATAEEFLMIAFFLMNAVFLVTEPLYLLFSLNTVALASVLLVIDSVKGLGRVSSA